MNINELKGKSPVDVVSGEITELQDERSFSKFGKEGRVKNGKMKDETGEVKLTLWNDQIDQVKVGDKVTIKDGYVGEWQGELQVSTGRNGSLEVNQ